MRPSGVIFDFDGVIADSEQLHLRAYQSVFAELEIDLSDRAYYDRYLGYDDVGVFGAVARDHGRDIDAIVPALIARKGVRYDALVKEQAVVFPAAVRCIGRLTDAGLPLAIASGALAPEIVAILEGAGLRHHFLAIVASGDTPASKPAPDPYARAADLLAAAIGGARPDRSSLVAIEDSHWGLVSARDAGLRTVAVTTTYPAAVLGVADVIVSSLDELTLDLLERLC